MEFGESLTLSRSGDAEQVQLSELLLRFADAEARTAAAAVIRARLEFTHSTREWALYSLADDARGLP